MQMHIHQGTVLRYSVDTGIQLTNNVNSTHQQCKYKWAKTLPHELDQFEDLANAQDHKHLDNLDGSLFASTYPFLGVLLSS
jgi:hypothetical protein